MSYSPLSLFESTNRGHTAYLGLKLCQLCTYISLVFWLMYNSDVLFLFFFLAKGRTIAGIKEI